MKIQINPESSGRCPRAAFQHTLIFRHPSVLSAQDQIVAPARVIGELKALIAPALAVLAKCVDVQKHLPIHEFIG